MEEKKKKPDAKSKRTRTEDLGTDMIVMGAVAADGNQQDAGDSDASDNEAGGPDDFSFGDAFDGID